MGGQLDRTVLPIPEPKLTPITTLDARDAKAPPRFEVKAPQGAPNVVIVLIDDIGFGSSSAFGGPINMPTLESAATSPETFIANLGSVIFTKITTAAAIPTRFRPMDLKSPPASNSSFSLGQLHCPR